MALDGWTFDPNGTIGYPLAAKHYREMDASGEVNFGETNTEATRNLITNWTGGGGETNLDFAADLLGYAEYTGFGSGVTRVLPDNHPELNWLYAMTTRRTAVTPSSVDGLVSNWTMAKYAASYREVDYFVRADDTFAQNELYRFVSRKVIPKGDYLQLSVNAFSWRIAGGNLGSVPGIIVPTKTLEYTWHMVPSKPAVVGDSNLPLRCPTENTIVALLGTTNSFDFDDKYSPGTVLFVGADAALIPPRFNNLYHWTIKYFFECKDHGVSADTGEHIGVNYIYNNTSRKWDEPWIPAAGGFPDQFLYNYADLNALFVLSAGS